MVGIPVGSDFFLLACRSRAILPTLVGLCFCFNTGVRQVRHMLFSGIVRLCCSVNKISLNCVTINF